MSLAIVLHAIRHKWTHPTLLDLPSLEGWKAELTKEVGYIPGWFTCWQTVMSLIQVLTRQCTAAICWSQVWCPTLIHYQVPSQQLCESSPDKRQLLWWRKWVFWFWVVRTQDTPSVRPQGSGKHLFPRPAQVILVRATVISLNVRIKTWQ